MYDTIKFKRVDKLPINTRKKLQKQGIYDGIVRINIKNGNVINMEQSLKLPSQVLTT